MHEGYFAAFALDFYFSVASFFARFTFLGMTEILLGSEQDNHRVHLYLAPGKVACSIPEGEVVLAHSLLALVTCERCIRHARKVSK